MEVIKKVGEIAVVHANTTMKNHFRPDYSSYHVIDYDINTGEVLGKKTFQGYSDSSAWARGQGWALYGYTMMYRFTKDQKYLDQARHIAGFILNNPTLPEDKIPYWDFNDPKIPDVPRDASAAAVIASALLELGQYTYKKEKENYINAARQMLISLSGKKYHADLDENGGFLLMHSTGGLPLHSEIDVPLIYADYYFLEALKRYKDWYL
jgi:rhamnogalacturonyl hydrolase YesR